MFGWDQVRRVHLELTARCNAACPQCPRNDATSGGVNPHLALSELSLADIRAMFPTDVVEHLRGFLLCGNYGDPMVAKDLVPILQYLREQNPKLQIKMNTNGSARNGEFWRALAGLVTSCTFSIDGLEDTNDLYRRNTVWPKIIDNVRAFIGAGGRAHWDFIVFRHNEHQVEAARALSEELGFAKFTVKKTSRFQKDGKMVESVPVVARDGAVEYQLEMPTQIAYRNEALRKLDTLANDGGYQNYLETTPITCKAVAEQQIYITADGWVLPCCWLGALYVDTARDRHETWRRINAQPGGVTAIDAKQRPLRSIIEDTLFQHDIPAAWQPGKLGSERLKICAKICGDVDARSAMYR